MWVYAFLPRFASADGFDDALPNLLHVLGGLETLDNVTFAVNKELCEVPLDVCLIAELLVVCSGEGVKECILDALSKAFERLLCCEVNEEGICVVAVYIYLLELREVGSELHGAEFVDLVRGAGSLVCELVAREVKDLKSLILKLFVHFLKRLIVRCETAACCGVYDEKYLSLVVCK